MDSFFKKKSNKINYNLGNSFAFLAPRLSYKILVIRIQIKKEL